MNRRCLLQAALGATLARSIRAAGQRPPRLLLRSSWQTVNIGDIAHTPGVLRLLEEYLPQAEVRLWPSSVGDGVEEMLHRRFPKLQVLKDTRTVQTAFGECDFLLHGSGASLVAADSVAKWRQETGKPYGIYGITLPDVSTRTLDLLNGARFVFCRDSVSLALARSRGCTAPVLAFGPDGAFGVDVRNDDAAKAFLQANALEEGRFLCCIPRLRYTPYWLIRNRPRTVQDEQKHARNEAMKEHDHAPLREAISAVIRQTGLKVLLCPEDRSQMAVGKEMIFDRLPDDVRAKVVWREQYWLTDEAVSTYVRSAGLFGNEMHSPIMCIAHGVPALVCRFEEQTSKGLMWRDIGLGDWLFDLDQETDIRRLVPTVLALAQDPAAAQAKARRARDFVRQRQQETMAVLQRALSPA
ncbi:MAG: polysaccharide pyruvyl transferase family protein [Planctomycetes bacterium]|nr:polysaccharide pyruvyl transferase family protein [Planctomycetota bacterium]